MPVRLATARDIPIMASVLAAAFGPDKLFRVLFPFQQEHPEDFERALRESLWLSWYDFRKVLMVSYSSEDAPGQEDGSGTLLASSTEEKKTPSPPLLRSPPGREDRDETITGMAEWERAVHGRAGACHVNGFLGWWDPRRLMKPLLSVLYRVRRFFVPNKAARRPTKADPQELTYWMLGPMIFRFGRQFMAGAHRERHWSLEILGVDPRYQGRGHGRELVEQGLEMARLDPEGDLPGCVMAADGKEGFYQKCGFKELVGYLCDAEDDAGGENPFRRNGVGGGAVLWTR
ncbi:hypothetical protein G647_01836 [Cladophialophora carrionii CBS 160.54]|uniref:N-acetyltransferase domain-containing protein n=1 Tax=Cladophialophora carrionii CBS 160.54 TaxID=1279043 RepID=V9DST9_9EURO|nr:uncharacterized protein G647_01836 [Cladophialophora carrionii CBS 160.54]ETI29383.1 hypothetical protein G647_01836 [Cladophialophora carrionii CBS 160.54]